MPALHVPVNRGPDPGADRTARMLYALAAGLGAASVMLAFAGWQSARRFDDQLARAARIQAEVLAREFKDDVTSAGDASLRRMFGAFSSAEVAWDSTIPRRILDAVRQAESCACAPYSPESGGAFWWSSRDPDRLVTEGMEATQAEPLRRAFSRIVTTDGSPRSSWTFLKVDGDGNEIIAPLVYRVTDGVVEVAGYLGSPRLHADAFMRPPAERVSTARYGSAGPLIVGWRIIQPGGDTALAVGAFDASLPALTVEFLRPGFHPDTSHGSLGFLSPVPAPNRPHEASVARPDPRVTPYRLLVQVNPVALGEFLYGTGRAPLLPFAVLLVVTIALTVATLHIARRFVRHVREREAFATAVAHDLRTPLTQILLYGESLQLDRPATRTREEAARVIVRETRRLIHLVENALQFVRGGRARPSLHIEPVDLGAVVSDVLLGLGPVLERSNVSVNASLPEGIDVEADRDALAQVLTNLIDNAVRFGPSGQTLDVSLQRLNGVAELHIDDQGTGVPVHLRKEIFKPFVRAGRSQGTGIGLAVSRQLVELMGGRLVATGAPTGGARFSLTMAARSANRAEVLVS